MANQHYLDPDDFSAVYDARKTIMIAFSNSETRRNNLKYLADCDCDVCDVYKNPDLLIPRMLHIPCAVRLIDYATYLRIEPAYRQYVEGEKARELIPSVIYGTEGRALIDDVSVIDASKIYPPMLASYFSSILKRR